jgi:hypothetical protein
VDSRQLRARRARQLTTPKIDQIFLERQTGLLDDPQMFHARAVLLFGYLLRMDLFDG